MALIMAAVWSIGILGILCVCAFGTWQIFLWVSSRSVDRVRTSTQVEQINALHSRWLQRLEFEAQRKREAEKRAFTDLDGKRVYLNRQEQQEFKNECLQVLGLSTSQRYTKQSIRQHWRKHVLRWHPDQGGDSEIWLAKIRAYEALIKMEAKQN